MLMLAHDMKHTGANLSLTDQIGATGPGKTEGTEIEREMLRGVGTEARVLIKMMVEVEEGREVGEGMEAEEIWKGGMTLNQESGRPSGIERGTETGGDQETGTGAITKVVMEEK